MHTLFHVKLQALATMAKKVVSERERQHTANESGRERERGSHLVFVSGLHLQFVLGNLGLTLVPQLLDGGLQSGVQEVTEIHTLYGRLLQLGVETGQLLQGKGGGRHYT